MSVSKELSDEDRNALLYNIALNNEFEKRECEGSLEKFTKLAWDIIEPGTELKWNWHLSTICGYLQAFHDGTIPPRLIITVPPGTLKSILVSVMYPAFVWVHNPDKRFLTVSNEQGLAIRDALRMKQIITSEWFQSKWPLALQADQNEKTLYANEKRGFRQAVGITASNTGKRGDCLIGSTLISTEIGDIRIDNLCDMDNPPLIYSYNHKTNKVELKEIKASRVLKASKVLRVSTLSSDIICTPDHKIYTDGGYIEAKNIKGRVLSELQWTDNKKEREKHTVYEVLKNRANLSDLWREVSERLCGVCEKPAKKCERERILQQRMQQTGTQSRANNKELCGMWGGIQTKINKKKQKILFSSVYANCAITIKKAKRQALRDVWVYDGYKQQEAEILLYGLQEQSPFTTHERGWELLFQIDNGKRWFISSNATINNGARHEPMFSLRSKWSGFKEKITNPSLRRGYRKQQSVKSGYCMRRLSHEDTQIKHTLRQSISRVTKVDCNKKISVYDIQVEGNGNFFANGILVHNCLIMDDLISAKNSFSEVIRTGVNNTYDQELCTRLNDPVTSGILLIMQRLHEGDLAGHLLKKTKTKWTHLSIPMEYENAPQFDPAKDIGRPELNDPRTKKGELLFPKRFNREAIEGLKEDLGEYGTSGQMQQRPIPDGGGIIKDYWWRIWPNDKPLPICDHIFLSYDTAFSEKDMKNAAFSAMTRWGVFWNEQRERYCLIVLGQWFGRVGYDELRKNAKEWDKLYEPDAHLIEKKATGISLLQDLRRALPSKIRSYCPGKGEDKISRGHSVSPMFEAGLVYAPDRQWANNKEGTGLINYVAKFPSGEPPTADIFDTVTQACIYLRAGHWVNNPDDSDDDDTPEKRRKSAYG